MRTRQQSVRQNNLNRQQEQNLQSSSVAIVVEQAVAVVASTTTTTTRRTRRKSESSKAINSTNNSLNRNTRFDLKRILKKATTKFNRACKQILKLDQKINDLQNSYTNAIETDRKTFKIVYRMQLATLEGLHEAYIEYIEKKVNEIRDLKNKIFGVDDNRQEQQEEEEEASLVSTH